MGRTRGIVVAGIVAAANVACGGDGDVTGPRPGALRFTAISAGYYHTCALAADRRAYCWGGNTFGTLGDGSTASRSLPTLVTGGLAFSALDAGAGHNCALTSTGEAWCWGQNDEGQLGDATFTPRAQPVRVSGNPRFTQVSAGHAHSCGIMADGSGWCWGDDVQGQLGDGENTVTKSAVPVRVQLSAPLGRIEAGYYQTCALTRSGEAYCWGRNDSQQNGDGSTQARSTPVRVQGTRSYQAIAPGDRFVCALSSSETWCWGSNRFGELGTAPDASAPVRLTHVQSAVGLAASSGASTIPTAESYACALQSGGSAYCWGGAVRGLRGRDAVPRGLGGGRDFDEVAGGAQHICALDRAGHAWCGGGNYLGQLGTGTTQDPGALVPVAGPGG